MIYPFDSLTIITPIVFFVLLFSFPVIGVFAGWKRAAYWGGGEFLFYIIGLIVWKTAGGAIGTAIAPTVQQLLGDKAKGADLSQLINSVVTPAFYLIWMIVANIILVICYYAFAKRLIGIGKYANKTKKNKEGKAVQVKAQVQTKNGSVANTRWFNMVVGGVGFTVLMLPITFSTTQAVALTTTNTATRKTNNLTSSLYGGCQALSSSMTWFSFYDGTKAGEDYDALFSLISLNNKTVTYTDPVTGQTKTGDPVSALTDTVSNGMTNVINTTKDLKGLESKEETDKMAGAINGLAKSWDTIMASCGGDVNVMLNSSGVTQVIKTMIGDTSKDPIKITEDNIKTLKDPNGVYNKTIEAYTSDDHKLYADDGDYSIITPIQNVVETSQQAFDDIVSSVMSMYDTKSLTSQDSLDFLKTQTETQLQMFIRVKGK